MLVIIFDVLVSLKSDYKYNKPLKWTRRILIIWTYLFAGIHGSICAKKNFFRDVDNDFIIASAIFFLYSL